MTGPSDDFFFRVDPDELAAELQEIREYWNAKRGARAMPRRADIDPAELRLHLPFLSLFEVLHDAAGLDFRFRLIGTEIAGQLGRDNTGRTLREVLELADPELRQCMLDACSAAVTQKRPVLYQGTLREVGKEFIIFQALRLPLSEDGEKVSMLLGRACFVMPELVA